MDDHPSPLPSSADHPGRAPTGEQAVAPPGLVQPRSDGDGIPADSAAAEASTATLDSVHPPVSESPAADVVEMQASTVTPETVHPPVPDSPAAEAAEVQAAGVEPHSPAVHVEDNAQETAHVDTAEVDDWGWELGEEAGADADDNAAEVLQSVGLGRGDDEANRGEPFAEVRGSGEGSSSRTPLRAGETRHSSGTGAADGVQPGETDIVEPAQAGGGDSHTSTTPSSNSDAESSHTRRLSVPLTLTLFVIALAILAGLWHSPRHRLHQGHFYPPWKMFPHRPRHDHHWHGPPPPPPPPPPGAPFPDMSSVHSLADLLSHLFAPAWGLGRTFGRGRWCDRRASWQKAAGNAERFLGELPLREDGSDYVVRIPKARIDELSRVSPHRTWDMAHRRGAFDWFGEPSRRPWWRRIFLPNSSWRSHRHGLISPGWMWGWGRHGHPHHHHHHHHRHHLHHHHPPPHHHGHHRPRRHIFSHHHPRPFAPHLDPHHPAFDGGHGHPCR